MKKTDMDIIYPLEIFYEHEKSSPNRVYFRQPLNGTWHELTRAEVGQEVRKMANALKKLNLPEKSCIAILSKNCAHWVMADLAIWMAGHISVPLYPTLNSSTIREILDHSESKLVFAGKLDDWSAQKEGVPKDMPKICFPHWKNEGCETWDDFIGDTTPLKGNPTRDPEDIATIIYTSGTTGTPKGVVHTFHSLAFPVNMGFKVLEFSPNDKFFSYLPIAHVAERLLVELGGLYSGGTTSFAETLDTFADNLRESQPTIFLAVPRIWTKFQLGILNKLPQKKLNMLTSIPILGSLVKKKIKTQLGLKEARYCISGAAAISADLLRWFNKLGIRIHEAYGLTENFCYSTFNFKNAVNFGTVGQAWPESEVKIGKNNEILLRSKANMVGYYKEPKMTAEVIDDKGWFYTGDQGEIDKQGYLRITGRVKELFKTAKGKYVAPSPIETYFSKCSLIEQVCVCGSGLPQPLALVVLSELASSVEKGQLQKEIDELLKTVNDKVENFERLNSIVVVKDEWSTDSGILTPTMKIKRNVIEKKYGNSLEGWYQTKETVMFV